MIISSVTAAALERKVKNLVQDRFYYADLFRDDLDMIREEIVEELLRVLHIGVEEDRSRVTAKETVAAIERTRR